MGTILKYLKKHIFAVLLIIGFLWVQATADLALPDYTADIVNVGIQNSGIVEVVPEVIRKSELDNLLLFVSDEDAKLVWDNYSLVRSTAKNLSEYPIISSEMVMEKTGDDDISGIISTPILFYQAITADDGTIKSKVLENFPNSELYENVSLIDIFKSMPKEALLEMLSQDMSQFNEMPETITDAMIKNYIKDEYKTIEVDVDKIQSNYILKTGSTMTAIALISLVATVLVGFFGSKVAAKMAYKLRNDVFEKVVKFSNEEFQSFSTASLITRTTNDIQQIQNLMVMLLRIVFYAPILGIGGLMKILDTNASMAWIIGVVIAFLIVVMGVVIVIVIPKFTLIQKVVDKLNLITREILTGIHSVRAFSREKHEEKRFDKVNTDITKLNIFVNKVMSVLMPIMMLVMNGVVLLVVWVGAKEIDLGNLQIGDMLAFIQYAMQIIMAFLMISIVFILLPRASVSAKRISEVLKKEIKIKDPKESKKFKRSGNGLIEFKNVTFRYPGANENVLENISFVAKPGETTAFIGSTGCGKTTIVNLIPRFFDVTEGKVLVDGLDVREVTQEDLRSKIGYIPQKGVLFSGTVLSNVKYGDSRLNKDRVKKAIEIAQASDFVYKEKEGVNKKITQAGTNVSGGQKQRLSIARAIAINLDIYIFDDSFSALDFKTDSELRKALKPETENSTVLIVAQRVSTVMNADQIIVLENGKIVGLGTHKELLKKCKVYEEIASSQLTKEEL